MKNGRAFFLIATLACCALSAFAQKPAQYIRMGDEAADARNYPLAESFYRQAYLLDSSDFDLTVKYAEASRQIKDYRTALHLYEKAWYKDEGKLFPEGLFWIAMIEKQLGRYEEAGQHFRKYAKKFKKNRGMRERAEQEAGACDWVLGWKPLTDTLALAEVTGEIRTAESEIAPVLLDSTLYFSRHLPGEAGTGPHWVIMQAKWNTGEVTNARIIRGGPDHYANLCMGESPEVFFTRCSPGQPCELWMARLVDGALTAEQRIAGVNDAASVSTQPHYTKINGVEYLFFSSDREDGHGGMDIWYSRRKDESWSEPVNAGKRINTPGDEVTPFYAGGALWFSSDWHYGFGGLDVFRSAGQPGSWSAPEHAGKPLNTAQNEIGFALFPREGWYFVSSNRTGSTTAAEYPACCNDLYAGAFSQEEERSTTTEEFTSLAQLNLVLPVRLYFHNDEPNPRSRDSTTTVRYGEAYQSYLDKLPAYREEVTRDLTGSKREDAEIEVESFFRQKVEEGMNDLQQFRELLLKELAQGKHVQLSIRGFASPRAKSDYNEVLTKRRIASLVNELRHWQNGALLPYIEGTAENGAALTFRALPFGENKADTAVSDDLADEKSSIYSLGARLERKIEIESVEWVPQTGALRLSEEVHDFGRIRSRDGIVYHKFSVSNAGDSLVVIDSLAASCGCTQPELDCFEILPGESATLKVGFDPFGKKGKEMKQVIIYIRGEEPRVVQIMAEVL